MIVIAEYVFGKLDSNKSKKPTSLNLLSGAKTGGYSFHIVNPVTTFPSDFEDERKAMSNFAASGGPYSMEVELYGSSDCGLY